MNEHADIPAAPRPDDDIQKPLTDEPSLPEAPADPPVEAALVSEAVDAGSSAVVDQPESPAMATTAPRLFDWRTLDLQPTVPPRPQYRLFSPGKAAFAGFVGGPLAAATIVAINLWRLKQRGRALVALCLGIVILVLCILVGTLALDSVDRHHPTGMFGGLVGVATGFLLAKLLMGDTFDEFEAQRGTPASGFFAASIGFAISMALLGAFLFLPKLAGMASFGRPVKFARNQTIYFRNGADHTRCREIGRVLTDNGFGEPGASWDVQIGREPNGDHWLAIIFDPIPAQELELVEVDIRHLAETLSVNVFNGRLTAAHLCNEWFRPWKTLPIVDPREWDQQLIAAGKLSDAGNYVAAEQAYRHTLRLAEEFDRRDHRIVISLNNIGNMCLQLGKLDTAQEVLARAIRLGTPGSYELGYAYNKHADVCLAQDRPAEAVSAYRQAAAIRETHPGEKSRDLIDSLIGLGNSLQQTQDYQEAETAYYRALRICEDRSAGQPDTEAYMALHMLVACCRKRENPAAAEVHVRRMLDIARTLPEPVPDLEDDTLNLLGDVLLEAMKYPEAEEVYRDCLTRADSTHGAQSRQATAAVSDLARLHLSQKNYAEAETLLRKILALAPADAEPLETLITVAQANLGQLCLQQGRLAEGDGLLRQAIAFFEKEPQKWVVQRVHTLTLLASSLEIQDQHPQAEELYRSALIGLEQIHGPRHQEVALGVANVAMSCHFQKKYAEAEPLYQQALTLCNSALGPGDATTVWIRQRLAMFYSGLGRGQEAEPLYRASVTSLVEIHGEDDPRVAEALSALASFYVSYGRLADAEPVFRRVIAIREITQTDEDLGLAATIHRLAEVTRQRGDLAESIDLYGKAIEAFSAALGKEHPILIGILEKQAWLLRKAGRTGEAGAVEKRAAEIRDHWLKARPDAVPVSNGLG